MNNKTKNMVGVGLFTAIVVVLQFLGGGIKFGMFSISLVLVPIVVGSAVYGWKSGASDKLTVNGIQKTASGSGTPTDLVFELSTPSNVLSFTLPKWSIMRRSSG